MRVRNRIEIRGILNNPKLTNEEEKTVGGLRLLSLRKSS